MSGIMENIFFHLKACERRNFDFFLCSYGCVVGPLKIGLYKLNGGSGRRHAVVIPGPTRLPDPLQIHKNTQKSKFLLSQALK